ERMRTSVTGANDIWQRYELRSSDTPMLMGVMQRSEDWNAITRWSQRRQISDGARVRVRNRDGKTLVLDFDSPFPVNYVWARRAAGLGIVDIRSSRRPDPGQRGRLRQLVAATLSARTDAFLRKGNRNSSTDCEYEGDS